jgi:hypothetical protein
VRAALATAAVTVIVVANGAFFVSARPLARDFDTPKPAWRRTAEHEAYDWIFSRTAAALRQHEEVVATFVAAIRGLYPERDTAVITELGNARSYPWLRHAMFYLPEYSIYELRVGDVSPGYYAPRLASSMVPLPVSQIELPAGTRRLVWFVDHWSPATERPPGLVEIEIPHGRYLYVLPLDKKPVAYAGYTLVRAHSDAPGRSRAATAPPGRPERVGVRGPCRGPQGHAGRSRSTPAPPGGDERLGVWGPCRGPQWE